MSDSVVSTSYARAGLLGNPSDGYHGKSIAFAIRQLHAVVTLKSSPVIEIRAAQNQKNANSQSIHDFVRRLDRYGFYDADRLIKAAIKQLYDYCQSRYALHEENFSIEFETNIPRSVGLAGSSAIITATLKSLTRFYDLDISQPVLASLALSAEKDLLGISAGLMDRVIQMMNGMVFMDFSIDAMKDENGVEVGNYQAVLPGACESRFFVAWADKAAEPTEVLHNRLSNRYSSGDKDVVQAMQQFADLAEQGRAALQQDDPVRLSELVDANFDLRASICQLPGIAPKDGWTGPASRMLCEVLRIRWSHCGFGPGFGSVRKRLRGVGHDRVPGYSPEDPR